MLYGVVREQLETFLAHARERERVVPRFVERENSARICNAGSSATASCASGVPCRHELLVAFFCKWRGFCPSCVGRRMSDTAAHLVGRVIPEVTVRQWVLSLPHSATPST